MHFSLVASSAEMLTLNFCLFTRGLLLVALFFVVMRGIDGIEVE